MFIDHISMYSDHPEKTKEFYEKYFKGESNQGIKNEYTDTLAYWLSFGGGGTAKLEIVNRPEISNLGKNHIDLGYLRLAFMQDSQEEVDDLVNQLKADGYQVLKEPALNEDGYYSGVILDPEDNQVEIIYGRPGGLHCPTYKQRKKK